jgi:hypothetical protein
LNDTTGAQRLFYHSNILYSVFALTDETEAIAERYMYDAFQQQFLYSLHYKVAGLQGWKLSSRIAISG